MLLCNKYLNVKKKSLKLELINHEISNPFIVNHQITQNIKQVQCENVNMINQRVQNLNALKGA